MKRFRSKIRKRQSVSRRVFVRDVIKAIVVCVIVFPFPFGSKWKRMKGYFRLEIVWASLGTQI